MNYRGGDGMSRRFGRLASSAIRQERQLVKAYTQMIGNTCSRRRKQELRRMRRQCQRHVRQLKKMISRPVAADSLLCRVLQTLNDAVCS